MTQRLMKPVEIECIGCGQRIILDSEHCGNCGQKYQIDFHDDAWKCQVAYPLIGERKHIEKLNIAETIGWKGNSGITFQKSGNDFLLLEYRKDKNTGEVEEMRTVVKYEDIQFLWDLMKNLPLNETFSARYFWKKIIDAKDLPIDVDAFNGGRNRNKIYFPFWYYPIKCLEYLQLIDYYARGDIAIKERRNYV